jgi:hypothetical protein
MGAELFVFAAESVASGGDGGDEGGGPGAAGIVQRRLPAAAALEDLPFAGVRRMARVSQLALAAGSAALAAAGIDAARRGGDSLALSFCSGFGALDHTEVFYRQVLGHAGQYPSPSLFAESVINAPAGHLSIALGIRGSVRTLAVGRSDGLAALCHVLDDLVAGDATQAALFVAADSPTPFCLEVLAKCDDSLARRPGAGIPAGEGAVALLLGRRDSVPREPIAAITAFATRQSPWDPAAALERLAWPAARPWRVRTSSRATMLGVLEERALRRRWPGVPTMTAAPDTGFLFAAQGPLEVALAARSAAPGRPELVTGADAIGTASFVEVGATPR